MPVTLVSPRARGGEFATNVHMVDAWRPRPSRSIGCAVVSHSRLAPESEPEPEPATPTRVPGLRERNKAAQRERILAAVRERLGRQGYRAMTTAQIAQDAGVAAGTVFTYAATKPEMLMMATHDRWKDSVPSALAGSLPEDRTEAVRALVDPIVATAVAEPENSAAIARELLFGQPGAHHDAVLVLVRRLEEAIARIIADGDPGPSERTAADLVVMGVVLELHRDRTEGGRVEGLEERIERVIGLFID